MRASKSPTALAEEVLPRMTSPGFIATMEAAGADFDELKRVVPLAIRMLDNAIDVSRFPLKEQENEARAKRRIGLGVTGLADALIMCGVRYGSTTGVQPPRTNAGLL